MKNFKSLIKIKSSFELKTFSSLILLVMIFLEPINAQLMSTIKIKPGIYYVSAWADNFRIEPKKVFPGISLAIDGTFDGTNTYSLNFEYTKNREKDSDKYRCCGSGGISEPKADRWMEREINKDMTFLHLNLSYNYHLFERNNGFYFGPSIGYALIYLKRSETLLITYDDTDKAEEKDLFVDKFLIDNPIFTVGTELGYNKRNGNFIIGGSTSPYLLAILDGGDLFMPFSLGIRTHFGLNLGYVIK
jgi:hypothetical protein